jgi:hypothetical protein
MNHGLMIALGTPAAMLRVTPAARRTTTIVVIPKHLLVESGGIVAPSAGCRLSQCHLSTWE